MTLPLTSGEVTKLENACRALQDAQLGTAINTIGTRGAYTVLSADDTANTVDIATGVTSITGFIVQILRSGAVATSDAAVSASGGTLTVADGITYVLTTDDVINWIAY